MEIEKLQTIQKGEITKHTKNIESLNEKIQKAAIEKEATNRKVQSIDKDVKEISKTLQENLDILSNLSGKPIQQGGSNILYQIDLTTFKTELKRQENNKYIGILKQLYDTLNGIKEQQEAEEKEATTASEEKIKHEETIKKLKEKLKKLNEEKERRKQEEEEAKKAEAKKATQEAQEKEKRLKEQKAAAEEAAQEKEKRLKEQKAAQEKIDKQKKEIETRLKENNFNTAKAYYDKNSKKWYYVNEGKTTWQSPIKQKLYRLIDEYTQVESARSTNKKPFDDIDIDTEENYKKIIGINSREGIKGFENMLRAKKEREEAAAEERKRKQKEAVAGEEERKRKQKEAAEAEERRKQAAQRAEKEKGILKKKADELANIARKIVSLDKTKEQMMLNILGKIRSGVNKLPNTKQKIQEYENGIKYLEDQLKKLQQKLKRQQQPSRGSQQPSRGAGNICPGKQDMLKAFKYVISYAFTSDPLDQYLIKFKQFAAGGVKNANKRQKSVLQIYSERVQKQPRDTKIKPLYQRSCDDLGRQKIRREIEYMFQKFWDEEKLYNSRQIEFKNKISGMMQELLDSISTNSARVSITELDKKYRDLRKKNYFEGTIEESDSSDLISESSNLITINNSSIEQQGGKRKSSTRAKSKSSTKKEGPCWVGYHKVSGKKDFSKGSCVKNKKLKSNDKINKMKYKLFQKLVSKNLI